HPFRSSRCYTFPQSRPSPPPSFPYTALFRSGVDAESLSILADILREELSDGTTVVMVTHELGPIRDLVSRSITLEAGLVCDTCEDRKSTRLNSSHVKNSYAVLCLKKKSHLDH